MSSQAGDCRGGIPLQVHPEVLQVQRPYHPTAEWSLFSLARVDQFLSQFTWQYKVSTVGQIPIHDYQYSVGVTQAGKTLDVRFDPRTREFIFSDAQTTQEVKRHPARGLDVSTITGLNAPMLIEHQPIQLSFAF